jgi:NAD(P)H-dependent FMN reductase
MIEVVGLAGSLRKGSLNRLLLEAAVDLAPTGLRILTRSIHGIPLYDGDIEAAEGIPEAVQVLKNEVAGARGLLLVTPEYNNSIPGPFKNAIDWLSRPPGDSGRVFGGKPVAVIGASPGAFGTMMSQAAWLPVIRALGMKPFYGATVYVSNAHKAFDKAGHLADEGVRQRLARFLAAFCEFIG